MVVQSPSPVPQIDIWFRSEVARWRSGAALVWSVVLTTPVVYIGVAVATANLFHPLQWISASILRFFSTTTWPYIFVIAVANVVLTVQNSKHFTVVPVVYSTRLERISSVVRLSSLYYLAFSAVLCGTIAWSYTGLVQGAYHRLSVPCTEASTSSCLNEHQVFLVLHGAFLGVCYRLSSAMSGSNHLVFPIIQQSKFFQMKISAFPIIVRSMLTCLNKLKYFCLLYYLLLGVTVQNFFSHNVGLSLSADVTPLNSVSGLFDLSLLWHCALSGTLTLSLLALCSHLVKLYHTQGHEFLVETTMEQYKNLCLHNALSCPYNNIIQYLGYQDLFHLAKHSPIRRQQVFCLTQLGGHPQNWSNLSRECLSLLRGFVDELRAYNLKAMGGGSMKHLTGENALISGPATTNGLRQRIISNDVTNNTTGKPTNPSAFQLLIADLRKKKLVAYLIAEDPAVGSRKLFAQAQLYIWAVDALSYLTCASYTEDKFGVVQKSLPEIIEILLALQEQVEKHLRLMSNIGKRPESEHDVDAALRNGLKSTVKVALYRVITIFDSHIRSIPLSADHMRRLNHFLDYKE